ncbi:M56 family metallopeptidase [Mucilaginibacter sp. McL0603]|uniref:M56 family metallopeptidase n=1 Tax=Mucilaginibacter sp. McL0603 TaxID=3415670 RepID=UPI003CFAC01B
MIPYILHVALLISVCLLFYKIFLQKETFYHLNRVVLLICLALSFVLPLISIPQAWTLRNAPVEKVVNTPEQIAPIVKQQMVPDKESIKQEVLARQQILKTQAVNNDQDKPFLPIAIKWMFYLYWAGVAAFGLNLLLQVVVLLIRAYSNPVIKDGKFRIIEVKGDKAPCSFGNNIFINPEKYDWDTYNQILMHEKVHIQQGHSFDILLAEIVLVFQWFNPFAWLYRGELENNLEFLTDEAVLDQNSVEKSSYQMSLLKVSAPHLALSVTTNYNQSLLKKRIVMMNAKKSNIHTMWKYFILVPIMGGLACALNQTIAYSQAVKNTTAKAHTNIKQAQKNWGSTDRTVGSWFATIKGERVRMEFRGDDNDHDWNSSSDDFKLSELSSVPKDQKGDFTITRDAGTMKFNGKFDGNQGYGHYKFVANKEFTDYAGNEGITDMDYQDEFAFFIININKAYVHMLKNNGYGHISKDEMISMAALKVDEPFIKYWKQNGYPDISANELVSAKALGVDGEYVKEIHEAGYPKISYDQLISFKAQGITGAYIRGLKKAGKVEGKDNGENGLPSPDDISSYKALDVDSTYIEGLKNAGYANVSFNELTSMKALGITPEYIKEFSKIGYKDMSADELQSFKSLGITPEFVKGFEDIGYKNISGNELQSLKALGITPEYVKGFEALGYKDLSPDQLSSFKALGVTAEYARGIQALGYKQISPDELGSLKALGVTPGFIKGFKDIGFTDVSLDEISSLKATGVTPAYVSSMKAKGFNSKDLDKYIQMKNAFN